MEYKEKNENAVSEKELSMEELSEVTGGSGLRRVKKEKTHDISDDGKKRI